MRQPRADAHGGYEDKQIGICHTGETFCVNDSGNAVSEKHSVDAAERCQSLQRHHKPDKKLL
ncbi:MAG: hypothetical protein J0L53_09950 [Spirochaetes bacterium]|nr:hypothetical protein [Spirochaetota bacterium]MBX3724139.1 hypothetical protein [Turneriella sp.]